MTYQQARTYLEEASMTGITLGLSAMTYLLNELGNPQDDLQFVHIAGTNGKGSVLAYVSTILETAGYQTGRYISPTVMSYRERIQINRKNISKDDFAYHLAQIKKIIDKMTAQNITPPSVFEIETALGFLYFKAQNCHIVIMETGMGGTLDATNVIKNTLAAVITSVSFDHMDFLGDTLTHLAQAKAGIIKKNSHLIYGTLPTEAEKVIKHQGQQLGNTLHVADYHAIIVEKNEDLFSQTFSYFGLENVTIHLLGKHQVQNAILAIKTVQALNAQGFNITDDMLKRGLEMTKWFGRVTVVKEKNPTIIIDGAHNQEAAMALTATVKEMFQGQVITGVMGVFKDKEVSSILKEVAPVMSHMYTISLADKRRTMSAEALAAMAIEVGINATHCQTLESAIQIASEKADVVVVFGSLSHLGDVFKILDGAAIGTKNHF